MIFNVNVGAPARPVGYFSYGGNTYRFDGTSDVHISGVCRYLPYGTSGWKMWIWANGVSAHFDYINPQHSVGISAIGAGGNGGYARNANNCYGGYCGGGGGGRNTSWGALSPNSNVSFSITSSNTSASGGLSISAAKGGNGGYACGEAGQDIGSSAPAGSGNSSGSGGKGAYYNGNSYYGHQATGGGSGIYLFDNSGFDGTLYGAGAGGGGLSSISGYGDAGNGAGWGNRGSGARTQWDTPQNGIIALWHQG